MVLFPSDPSATINPMLEIPFNRESAYHRLRQDEAEYILRMEYRPYFITMGGDNAFPGGVICIWAPDRDTARHRMVHLFGLHWCTDYTLDEMVQYVQKWDAFLVGEYVV